MSSKVKFLSLALVFSCLFSCGSLSVLKTKKNISLVGLDINQSVLELDENGNESGEFTLASIDAKDFDPSKKTQEAENGGVPIYLNSVKDAIINLFESKSYRINTHDDFKAKKSFDKIEKRSAIFSTDGDKNAVKPYFPADPVRVNLDQVATFLKAEKSDLALFLQLSMGKQRVSKFIGSGEKMVLKLKFNLVDQTTKIATSNFKLKSESAVKEDGSFVGDLIDGTLGDKEEKLFLGMTKSAIENPKVKNQLDKLTRDLINQLEVAIDKANQ